jgi:hypothetical protein
MIMFCLIVAAMNMNRCPEVFHPPLCRIFAFFFFTDGALCSALGYSMLKFSSNDEIIKRGVLSKYNVQIRMAMSKDEIIYSTTVSKF